MHASMQQVHYAACRGGHAVCLKVLWFGFQCLQVAPPVLFMICRVDRFRLRHCYAKLLFLPLTPFTHQATRRPVTD